MKKLGIASYIFGLAIGITALAVVLATSKSLILPFVFAGILCVSGEVIYSKIEKREYEENHIVYYNNPSDYLIRKHGKRELKRKIG